MVYYNRRHAEHYNPRKQQNTKNPLQYTATQAFAELNITGKD